MRVGSGLIDHQVRVAVLNQSKGLDQGILIHRPIMRNRGGKMEDAGTLSIPAPVNLSAKSCLMQIIQATDKILRSISPVLITIQYKDGLLRVFLGYKSKAIKGAERSPSQVSGMMKALSHIRCNPLLDSRFGSA